MRTACSSQSSDEVCAKGGGGGVASRAADVDGVTQMAIPANVGWCMCVCMCVCVCVHKEIITATYQPRLQESGVVFIMSVRYLDTFT
jgi:hypothetical protein